MAHGPGQEPVESLEEQPRKLLGARAHSAREALGALVHPKEHRLLRDVGLMTEEPSSEEASELVRELQDELRTERREVLVPLLRRISELGERLRQGQDVPPDVISEGLDLWQLYVDRLHDVHIGQFVAARASIPHTQACSLPMAEIEQEPERAAHRIHESRSMLEGYRSRPPFYRALLALSLLGNSTAELSWEGFEEDFAGQCLPDHLTPTALGQWRTSLVETRQKGEEARRQVAAYLARTRQFSPTDAGPPVPRRAQTLTSAAI